jgi:hypothetical protein
VIPTLFDLRTSRTALGADNSVYWWSEGNGACDCNRAIAFDGADEEMDTAMRAAHPGLQEWQGLCYGCTRFIAIDVTGDLAFAAPDGTRTPMTREEILIAMNSDYGT